jgi:hypothetical protein
VIRKAGAVLALTMACLVAACGRQVTPNPLGAGPGGLAPGYMSVKFDVAANFEFSQYRYFIIFNTSGNGLTPLTNPQQNNWKAYSYAIEVGGVGGGTFAGAYEYVRSACCPRSTPYYQYLPTTPSQLQYIPNSNGTGTEFTVIFQPRIFNGIPFAGVSPPPLNPNWLINAFTAMPNTNAVLQPLDSLGVGGGGDTTYQSPTYNIYQKGGFDQVVYALDGNPPSDPAAQIVSIEVANNPGPSPAPTATPTP